MAEQWEAIELDEAFRARRAAALALLRDSAPSGLGMPKTLHRFVLDTAQELQLWEMGWTDDDGALLGFALVGPNTVRPIDAARGFDENYGSLASWPVERGHVLSVVSERVAAKGPCRQVGEAGLDWRKTTDFDAEAHPMFSKVQSDVERIFPAGLTLHPSHPQAELVERLKQNLDDDIAAVRKRGEANRAEREANAAWRTLFSREAAATEEAALCKAFFRRAEAGMLGFDPPRSAEDATITAKPLPFCPGAILIEMLDRRGSRPRRARFLMSADLSDDDDWIEAMGWTSVPLHVLRERFDVHLTADSVPGYVDFFSGHLAGDRGIYAVVEDVDELYWKGVSTRSRDELAKLIDPVCVWNRDGVPVKDDEGNDWFLATAMIVVDRDPFYATFLVRGDGIVWMIDDQEVGQRLPIVPRTVSEDSIFVYVPRSLAWRV
ncbi:hypothetical protein [Stakelama tenebrarum]|uniref:Uncharacterized protein n=1 Tax=Stakelama tenebrarum TaxID=2711215 RepID=A0A6G6Y4M3_9SPHN|nr:hypothetical protein [Sphingosinithalassobacter tenebrarum]QIG79757.1 hypothetical protein G5C33_08095 [Sphingosinithalassobacter tenebrarum]